MFVQRCSGTTAGLGYLEVSVDCSLGGWHVRTVNTDWGEWHNSSMTLKVHKCEKFFVSDFEFFNIL